MQYEWAEDDFELPVGVDRLDLPEPQSGKTYVMYHGTTRKAAQAIKDTGFRQSKGGMLGPGVYLSRDLNKASRYPIGHPESDKVVIKVKVSVGKVIAINCQGHPRQKTWHDPKHGEVYDTAWVPPKCGMVKSDLEENCVWDPKRIQIMGTINPRPVQAPRPVQSPRPVQNPVQYSSYDPYQYMFEFHYPDQCPWLLHHLVQCPCPCPFHDSDYYPLLFHDPDQCPCPFHRSNQCPFHPWFGGGAWGNM